MLGIGISYYSLWVNLKYILDNKKLLNNVLMHMIKFTILIYHACICHEWPLTMYKQLITHLECTGRTFT